MVKTEQLHYLLMINKHQSLTAAAQELHMTQPALSIAIKNLENDLGLKLTARTSHGVTLTETGKNVAKLAQKAFVYLNAIEELATKITSKKYWDFDFYIDSNSYNSICQYIISYVYDLFPHCNATMNISTNKSYEEIFDKNPNAIVLELMVKNKKYPDTVLHKIISTSPVYVYFLSEAEFIPKNYNQITLKECINLPFIKSDSYSTQNLQSFFFSSLKEYGEINFVQCAITEQFYNFYLSRGIGCGIKPVFMKEQPNVNYRYVPVVDIPKSNLEVIYSNKADVKFIEVINSIFSVLF